MAQSTTRLGVFLKKQLKPLGQQLWQGATPRVMVMTVAGMGMSLLVDILIAARMGTSPTADALIIALGLPRLVETVGREGTRLSLMTLMITQRQQRSLDEYIDFISGLLKLFLIIGFGFVLMGVTFAPTIVPIIGPGLSFDVQQEATGLFRLGVILVFFSFGATVLEGFLNSHEFFVIVAARNAFVSTTVVIALALGWRGERVSTWVVLAYGIGYAFFGGWLLWHSQTRAQLKLNLQAWPDRTSLSQLWRAILYPTLGVGIRQGSRIAERALVSLVVPGGVSAYYFSFRIISATQTIIGISISTTGLPQLTKLTIKGEKIQIKKALWRQLKRTAILSMPMTLGIILFHGQIAKLLFGRGALQGDSTLWIGEIMLYMSLSIIFWSFVPTLTSGVYAYQKYAWTVYDILLVSIVHLLLAWKFSQWWGLVGIASALTLSTILRLFTLSTLIWLVMNGSADIEPSPQLKRKKRL